MLKRIDRRALIGALPALGLSGGLLRLASSDARAAASEPITVRTVSLSANTNKVFDELLVQEGLLQEFGVKPEPIYVGDGSKVIAALVSGAADVCMQVGFPSVIPAVLHGAKIKVVASSENSPETAVYSANPDIRSAKDLVGRTVGVGAIGALLHLLMAALLLKEGVDIKRVTFVNVGSSTDVFRAVVARKVDAGPGDNAFFENPGRYGVHALSDGALWRELPDFLNQVSLSTDEAISQRGEGIVRLLAAYRKLYRFLQSPDSRDAWRKAFMKVLNTSVGEADAQLNFYQKNRPFAIDLVASPERVRYIQDLNMKLGLQTSLLPYDRIVDRTLALRAMKLG